DGGVLEVDNVIVAPGGTLAGDASVVGRVSVATGGVIAPGDGTAGSIGTLSVTGDVDFSPAVGGFGLLEIDIDGLLSDMLSVSGNLDLSGATLDLNFIGPPTGMAYLIADYGTLTGTFGTVVDLPAGWHVDYTFGGMNRIAVVPEPSAIVLAGLGVAGIAAWRLRRKRPA
ncbi:MAG: PEP-CTERM sorting domain-containing protein, partial [Planctomycetaceae bacterium]